jgi:hypothetical protein
MAMGLDDPAFATPACVLWPLGTRSDHRDHPGRRVRHYSGLAAGLSGLLEVLRKLLSERIAVVSTQSSHRRSCDGSDDAAASMHDRQHDRSQPLASKPTILRLWVAK